MDWLNVQGQYRCVYINVEIGQSAREDVAEAMRAVFSELALRASIVLKDQFIAGIWADVLAKSGPHAAFGEVLSRWAADDPRLAILLIDEIDALVGYPLKVGQFTSFTLETDNARRAMIVAMG